MSSWAGRASIYIMYYAVLLLSSILLLKCLLVERKLYTATYIQKWHACSKSLAIATASQPVRQQSERETCIRHEPLQARVTVTYVTGDERCMAGHQ